MRRLSISSPTTNPRHLNYLLQKALGTLHLTNRLNEECTQVYEAFLRGEIEVPGKDLCDMSGATDRTPDQYTVYNVMLPRTYYPKWQGNIFEQRCEVSLLDSNPTQILPVSIQI